jgi:hypothetical protein
MSLQKILGLALCLSGAFGCIGASQVDDPKPEPQNQALCNNDAQVLDPLTLTSCGADAHCLDKAVVESSGAGDFANQLAPCPTDANQYCVPDNFIRTGGMYTPATCAAAAGAEGRCLSQSLPNVAAKASFLQQSTCSANELCSPCFDPVTGADTGACRLTCDAGPTTAALQFATCGEGNGHCAPQAMIPPASLGSLEPGDCDEQVGVGYLCVPDIVYTNGPYTRCSDPGNNGGPFGIGFRIRVDNGVCLPTNVLEIPNENVFPDANCETIHGNGFSCVPCINDNQPTGAPGCTP